MNARPSETPLTEEARRDELLRLSLREEIQRNGPIRFDRFLEKVLFDPRAGYYALDREILGRTGDFRTAPEVHPIFGATWAAPVTEALGAPGRRGTLIELGPGRGYLLEGLLPELVRRGYGPDSLDVWVVERRPLTGKGWEKVRGMGFPFHPVPRLEELPSLPRAVVLANEFLDALPFRRLRSSPPVWREIRVGAPSELPGGLGWVEGETVPPDPEGLPEAPMGTIYDLPSGGEGALELLLQRVERGRFLLADYGDETPGLLQRKPEGSLETHSHHSVGLDPFVRLGSQDISCWVDFSRVRVRLERAGWAVEPLQTQTEALVHWGLEDRWREMERSLRENDPARVVAQLSLKTLLHQYASHRVLVASRG
jgi:SAM-dependent MidA family methyltransferase